MKRLMALSSLILLSAGCATPAGSTSGQPVKPYPLDMCIVTDNELGSMGPPIVRVYDGQEIKFCCKPCVRKFEKNKDAYLGQLKTDKP